MLTSEKTSKASNAWLVRLREEARLNGYVLTIGFGSSSLRGIQAEDAMLVTEERDEKFTVIGIGRIFRKLYSLEDTSFYYDGYLTASLTATLDELKIPVPKTQSRSTDWIGRCLRPH